MLGGIEVEMPRHVAMRKRRGGDHLRVEPRVPRQQPVEVPAMTVGPVHHRGAAESPTRVGHVAIASDLACTASFPIPQATTIQADRLFNSRSIVRRGSRFARTPGRASSVTRAPRKGSPPRWRFISRTPFTR